MSAATIDLALAERRVAAGRGRRPSDPSSAANVRWRTKPSRNGATRHPALWKPISWRTADWSRGGSFLQTLVLTDIAAGLIECAPLLVR